MKRHVASLLVLGLMMSSFGYGCAVDSDDLDESSVETASAAIVTPTSWDYKFAASIDPEVTAEYSTELWGRVYHPATLTSGLRYPVVVFLHGNHSTCGTGSDPRIDKENDYALTGACRPNYVVVPSHLGYDYAAKDLASRGYVVVSINTNRGINGLTSKLTDDRSLILARGRMVLKHLALLSRWSRGVAQTGDPTEAAALVNHLDFTQVGLMGHSRGGEAVRAAYALYTDAGSPWPTRIATPVVFRGIFEIGPVDGEAPRTLDAPNLPWTVLLPMCDGDVSTLEGVRPFDRMTQLLQEDRPSFKSTFAVWGANHNYFNTEWQQSEAAGCVNHPALFSTAPGVSGSTEQQTIARTAITGFFTANVGKTRDRAQNTLFDPTQALPTTITSLTRVDRGYSMTPDQDVSLRLEEFGQPTGTSTSLRPTSTSNIEISHTGMPRMWGTGHDGSQMVGRISWTSAGPNTYFQTNLAQSGVSLTGYETLDIRVDRTDNTTLNGPTPTDFSVQLVTAQGTLSTAVPISQFVTLSELARGYAFDPDYPDVTHVSGGHAMFQAARIPLTRFGVPLEGVLGVRLTFDRSPSGYIYVANIRATRAPCASTPKLDLKVRQIKRLANEVQYRFQVFNRTTTAIPLSDLAVKLWISDSTSSLAATIQSAGAVYNASNVLQFNATAPTTATSRLSSTCTATPDRLANWAVTASGADTRTIPPGGGAWVNGLISVRRQDGTNFASHDNDYSRTPRYQGTTISDRTWPAVYDDDERFVLYYRGRPVTEYVSGSNIDVNTGIEPTCIAKKCVDSPYPRTTSTGTMVAAAGDGNIAAVAAPTASPSNVLTGAKVSPAASPGPISSGRILSVRATRNPTVPGGLDIELLGDNPIPVRDAALTLAIGNVVSTRAWFPDATDARRVNFTLTAAQVAALRDGEPVTAQFGDFGAKWVFGPLDLSMVSR